MGIKVNSFAELERKCQAKMRKAMEETVVEGWIKAKENAEDFYSIDSPNRIYNRTGKYGDAPDADEISGEPNHLHSKIFMNPYNHGYRTGTFSAQEVWQAAENHTSGVIGKAGRWAQTEKDIEDIGNKAFGKEFGH